MAVLFVEYPKCSTCKKAKKWLDEHGVDYVDRDIVQDRPAADELDRWRRPGNVPVRKLFNTSGVLYRELGVKSHLDAGMSDAEALDLLASDGKLVKRPLVVGDDFLLMGFREQEWQERLG